MSRPRSVPAEACLVCGNPHLYAKGRCKHDYHRLLEGKPDRTEADIVRAAQQAAIRKDHSRLLLRMTAV